MTWTTATNAAKYLPLFAPVEEKYGIPPNLLARIGYQESRWRDDIVSGRLKSKSGATGIMQMEPVFFPHVDLLDVSASIDAAGKYLANLHRQFGDWRLAVAAYNAGPGNVRKYDGIPPFHETQDYVAQVFADVPVEVA